MASDKGSLVGLYNHTTSQLDGKGVNKNNSESLNLLKAASDLRYGRVSNHYAVIKGDEFYKVSVDKQESIQFFKKAIEQKYPSAMYNYANMLRDGELVPVNKIETAYYHKMVDDHDHRISMVIYADMNAKGEGIPVDEGKATIYYMKAINRGSYLTMNNFADLLISKECGTECIKQVALFY